MVWIFFAFIGQFLNAIAVLLDKHIVTAKIVSRPIVYTFFVSFLSIIAIFALPFGVTLPNITTVVVSIFAAFCYILSIYLLYETLQHSDPSDTLPVIGGISALTTFIASTAILNQDLPRHFLAGFFILVLGMILISHFKFDTKAIYQLIGSGIFFGLSNVLVKLVFLSNTSFVNGFFWSRMANVLLSLSILLLPGMYKLITGEGKFTSYTRSGKKRRGYSKILFILSNKALAGAAFFFILLAIKFGEVSVVSALAATQYIFLFIFALLWSKSFPDYFSHKKHAHELIHKISATAIIVVGFLVLFL